MTTFVLIHGSYQGGWIWQRWRTVCAPPGTRSMPRASTAAPSASTQVRAGITTETHAAEIAELLFYEDLRDVVMVGTSSGGMVAVPRRRSGARPDRAPGLCRCAGAVRRRADPRHRPALDGDAERAHRRARRARMRKPACLPISTRRPAPGRSTRYTLHPIGIYEQPGEARQSFWTQPWPATVIWCRRAANPGRGASAPHRREAQGAMARARHRPLSDAQHARGADRAADRISAGSTHLS